MPAARKSLESPAKAPKVARGRPRDPNKRESILLAARRLFLGEPTGNFTMDDLAAAAPMSKATLYSYFRDRSQVLEAMVVRELERMVAEDWVGQHSAATLKDTLTEFGEIFIRRIASSEGRAFERILASAAASDPSLARRFFDAGPGRGLKLLEEILADTRAQAELDIADPEQAAEDLLGLWQGFLRHELDFAGRETPNNAEIRTRSAHGVSVFLRNYRR